MRSIPACWRGLRLGTQLALALGALALVVFGLVGAITVSVMRENLTRRLDQQLIDTLPQYKVGSFTQNRQSPHIGRENPIVAIYRFAADGSPMLKDSSNLPPDSTGLLNLAKAAAKTPRPLLQPMVLRGEDYRVAAQSSKDQVTVLGISQEETNHTLNLLTLVEGLTFVIALGVLVISGSTVLRRGLRPLGDMASTAHEIASTDLTGNSVDLSARADSTGGGIEVEELREAFNLMLEHIDSSLAARSAAEQRLRQFVADASHELRTPLTSIRGYADLFSYAAANEPAERERHLARMREEAARMSLLLDDLLLLARLDGAETPLRLQEVDLAEVVVAAAEAFHAGHSDHPLNLDVEETSVRLTADPMRLRQVLDNLLTNAAVHTAEGTQVSLRMRTEPGWAVVEVADAGQGIDPAAQAKVFDRFYRVDDSRTRGSGGTGLGLSVVYSLITAHGGTVSLASQPGNTVFTVRLPVM